MDRRVCVSRRLEGKAENREGLSAHAQVVQVNGYMSIGVISKIHYIKRNICKKIKYQ